MLLYRAPNGHYMAIPSCLRFAPRNGFELCYGGREVPRIVCAALIREAGGAMLGEDDDEILLRENWVPPRRRRTDASARLAA